MIDKYNLDKVLQLEVDYTVEFEFMLLEDSLMGVQHKDEDLLVLSCVKDMISVDLITKERWLLE